MLLTYRELLIAGIVVTCIALGLVLSIFIFYLIPLYYRLKRKREAVTSQTYPKQNFSLGK
jgi:hypothetical protein